MGLHPFDAKAELVKSQRIVTATREEVQAAKAALQQSRDENARLAKQVQGLQARVRCADDQVSDEGMDS